MRDNLDPQDATSAERSVSQEQSHQHVTPEQPLTDREVPAVEAHTTPAIHKWLDGDPVNESQLHAAEKEYDFWRRVEEEAGRRRRMKTPSSLPNEIMRAIKKEP